MPLAQATVGRGARRVSNPEDVNILKLVGGFKMLKVHGEDCKIDSFSTGLKPRTKNVPPRWSRAPATRAHFNLCVL